MSFCSSSLLNLICVKGIFTSTSNIYCILGKWSARPGASWCNQRGLSTATTAVQNQDSSPYLLLPPEYEGCKTNYKLQPPVYEIGKMTYKFYSILDNKIQTPWPDNVIRDLRLTCRGSSHGWLALLGPRNEGFFLYNPITRRHIKLPSIFNLPKLPGDDILRTTSSTTWRDVQKLILSCSPDEDEENCRAVMINGFGNMLAFCCPRRSKEWTMMRGNIFYKDCVYSARLKLFFVLTHDRKLETWDLGDPSSIKLIKVDECKYKPSVVDEYKYKPSWCMGLTREHLVVAGEDLLLVIQYTTASVGPDGSCSDDEYERPCPDNCRYMTTDFDIFKHDPEKGRFEYVDKSSSLGGLAIFVGKHNHSVAIPATWFSELKPDSIYFTDVEWKGPLDCHNLYDDDDERVGDRDIGIYNYKDKTVSQCYFPCDKTDVKKTTPIWFFPSSTI